MTNQINPIQAFLSNNSAPAPRTSTYGNTVRFIEASPQQKDFYLDLCDRKRITPRDITSVSKQELSMEIEKLNKLADPASYAQIETISTLMTEILELNPKAKPLKEAVQQRAISDKRYASALIESLKGLRLQLNEVAPLTAKQLETLVEWQYCPDIPWEDYEVVTNIPAFEEDYITPITYMKDGMMHQARRNLTRTEFEEQLKEKITMKNANKLIIQCRGIFFKWKQTRVTKSQKNQIRTMESRLANTLSRTGKVGGYNPETGDFETETPLATLKATYAPKGYEPITDEQLDMMSVDQATKWIDMLSAELNQKELYRFGNIYDDTQQSFQEKVQKYDGDRTRMGNAKSESDARIKEYQALQDLIYKIESVVGYKDDALHDLIKETMLDGDMTGLESASVEQKAKAQNVYQELKNFMFASIDFKRGAEQAKNDVGRLYTMCEESVIATKIVEELHEEVKKKIDADEQMLETFDANNMFEE